MELAPDTTLNHWRDTKRFFRTGGQGEWQDGMSLVESTEQVSGRLEMQASTRRRSGEERL